MSNESMSNDSMSNESMPRDSMSSEAPPPRAMSVTARVGGQPATCVEAASSLQRLAGRLDDHADRLAIRRTGPGRVETEASRCADAGSPAAVRSIAAALRLAAARLRAGTLPPQIAPCG